MAIIEFIDRDVEAKKVDRKKTKTEDKNKEQTTAKKQPNFNLKPYAKGY